MQFPSAKVLEIARIPKDTLRVWKKILSPIAYIDGRSRQYSLPELVGVCLIAQATQGFGIPISRFSEYAKYLFDGLETQIPPRGTPKVLFMTEVRIYYADPDHKPNDAAFLQIRVAEILKAISAAADQAVIPPDPQMNLPL